jgi:hypothetical protein
MNLGRQSVFLAVILTLHQEKARLPTAPVFESLSHEQFSVQTESERCDARRVHLLVYHQDFYWERERFLTNCVGYILRYAFPLAG